MNHPRNIHRVHVELLNVVKNLTLDEATRRPRESSWTILECLEHVFITNFGIYRFMTSSEAGTAGASSAELVPKEKMQSGLRDRSKKYQAPDRVRPTGRFKTLATALEKLEWLDAQFAAYFARKIPLDHAIWDHPIIGAMTKRDWLNFLIGHTERHTRQIEEILSRKEDAGTPDPVTME